MKSFVKLCTPKSVSAHIKEARRVGYEVIKNRIVFEIKDISNDALVMSGVRLHDKAWAVRFFEDYWQDPNPFDENG